MKKVWIASILAILMLLVPLNSVVGTNEVEDCNCKPFSDLQVVRIGRLLDRLESRINFIVLNYGHIPEVAEKCDGILEQINSNDFELFCAIIGSIELLLLFIMYNIPYELAILLEPLALIPLAIIYFLWMTYCKEAYNYPSPELTDK